MPDSWAGKRGKCPNCGRVISVPRPPGEPKPSSQPAQPKQGAPSGTAKPMPVDEESFVPFEMKDPDSEGVQSTPAKREEQVKVEGGILSFKCACGKTLKAPLGKAGRKAKCPQCQRPVEIPK